MMERAKTWLLAALVAASLAQSYLLANSSPNFDTIVPADYAVESKLEGTQAELSGLLFPKDIVLHFGNGEHTVLYPQMIFYQMIMEVVVQRTFDGLLGADAAADAALLESGGAQGVDIRFAEELPLPMLQQMMNVRGDALTEENAIDRIRIYTNPEREEVRVFFFGSDSGAVYEATQADLTIKDVERFVGFGESRVRYEPTAEGHYLPVEPLPMVQYRYKFRQFTPDQLQRSLFPDPFSTRNLTERDGSEIYTDGKRGLQLSMNQRWMRYTDPAASAEGGQSSLDAALSSVQFVNRHGGWNGDYLLEGVDRDAAGTDHTIRFRHYIGSYPGAYPIVGARDGLPFGAIQLTLRNRVVTGYERSTLQLEGSALERSSVSLPGGEALAAAWAAYAGKELVRAVFPAYRAVVSAEDVRLEPIWAVALVDGTVRELSEGGGG